MRHIRLITNIAIANKQKFGFFVTQWRAAKNATIISE